ncbi:MAG TPA: LAGLIDADG family homing endonuclease [Verrucomicrobiae bacterium]|nr:LAGLIDADG family homing endonuclease [Verrucomicrobiae bacterium]
MLYPNKSHRKTTLTPQLNEDLAELLGIIAGDGAIHSPWQLTISLNAVRDLAYCVYIQNLIARLFGIESKVFKRKHENCIVIVTSSSNVVEYLIRAGAVRGDKVRNTLQLPAWIFFEAAYERAYARGLLDTDGCLFVHRHSIKGRQYRNIGLCFSNYSHPLIHGFAEILHRCGIPAKISRSGKLVYVYKRQGVEDYLSLIGSHNPRITSVFQNWRDA